MQNSPLDNVIASRCVTSAGGKGERKKKRKKKSSWLEASVSPPASTILSLACSRRGRCHVEIWHVGLVWHSSHRQMLSPARCAYRGARRTLRHGPGPADLWGWASFPRRVCKSSSPEQRDREATAENVYFCSRSRARGIPLVAAGAARFGRILLCFCTLNWILGFGLAALTLLLVSLESGLIALLEAVSTFAKNQQAASTGRIGSELTTRKT